MVAAWLEESPWVEMIGWGHGVVLRSGDTDVARVQRLLTEHPSPERCAVVLEWMTSTQRRQVIEQLAVVAVELRPLHPDDIAAMTVKPSGSERWLVALSFVAAVPFRLTMRLRRRSTQGFQAVSPEQ